MSMAILKSSWAAQDDHSLIRPQAWELFSMVLGSSLWTLGSDCESFLLYKVAYIFSWAVFSDCLWKGLFSSHTVSVPQSKPVVCLEYNFLKSLGLLWLFLGFTSFVFPLNTGISSECTSWSSSLYISPKRSHWFQGVTGTHVLKIPKCWSLKLNTPELQVPVQ